MLLLLSFACVETSITAIEYTDTWVQGERPRGVDVLWVRDDSATMTEEQDLLLEAAEAFVTGLSQADVDFHLAMVSTDVENQAAGTLLGPVLTPDHADLAAAWEELLAVATTGSRDEHGIAAALVAADPTQLPEFARADADLEIVFFSDEDDHGETETADVLQALQDARPGVVVRVTAIVGDAPEGCASLQAAADPGFRYLALQELTGGLRESICSPDYGPLLNRVGLHALGMVDRFLFNNFPDPSSLEVYVDDEPVPANTEPGWTYEIGDNSLRFDNDAIPAPGATVYAVYKPFVGYRLEPDPDDETGVR